MAFSDGGTIENKNSPDLMKIDTNDYNDNTLERKGIKKKEKARIKLDKKNMRK